MSNLIEQAAALIAASDGILITAGAGMGVDSGLPDFRGTGRLLGSPIQRCNARIDFQSIAKRCVFENTHAPCLGFLRPSS